MDNIHLQQWAKRLNLIDDQDIDDYVLTPQEEEAVIENEIVSMKRYVVWKMAGMGYGQLEIENKIAGMDFKGAVDREAVLSKANMCKNQDLWQKKKREEEKQRYVENLQELSKRWTAKYAYGFMAWTSENVYGKNLVVNDDNKKLIAALCFYVSRDERFETELGYSFNKGLLIRGKCGIGKTYLTKCLEKNEVRPILALNMLDITDAIKSYGEFDIEMKENKVLYLDDVGTEEPVVKHYGTNIAWFKEFIETLYMKSNSFGHIIISTNNNFKAIEERYGFRVASRMRDMFNILNIDGEDMRG